MTRHSESRDGLVACGMLQPKKRPQKKRPPHAAHFLGEWRDALGFTQDQAQEMLGWSQSKVSRAENSAVSLSVTDLKHAAAIYGISTNDILHVDPRADKDYADLAVSLAKASPEQRREVAQFVEFVRVRDSSTKP